MEDIQPGGITASLGEATDSVASDDGADSASNHPVDGHGYNRLIGRYEYQYRWYASVIQSPANTVAAAAVAASTAVAAGSSPPTASTGSGVENQHYCRHQINHQHSFRTGRYIC
jgi:hypothetical protein